MVVLFCDNCKSIMKIQTEDKTIKYVCYSCGGNDHMDNTHIENVFYKEGQKDSEYNITSNMKYDRTLPRTLKVECRNPDCPSKEKESNPIIIYFSKDSNLSKGFMCTQCDACWL